MTDVPITGPFYHGTRAALAVGDLLAPGFISNYWDRAPRRWIYMTAIVETAVWGAEFAQGDGPGRIYIVEPTGEFFDDPNVTDKKFPGNPTMSYRSQAPLRVIGEVAEWVGHPPEVLQAMKDNVERLWREGAEIID